MERAERRPGFYQLARLLGVRSLTLLSTWAGDRAGRESDLGPWRRFRKMVPARIGHAGVLQQ